MSAIALLGCAERLGGGGVWGRGMGWGVGPFRGPHIY